MGRGSDNIVSMSSKFGPRCNWLPREFCAVVVGSVMVPRTGSVGTKSMLLAKRAARSPSHTPREDRFSKLGISSKAERNTPV